MFNRSFLAKTVLTLGVMFSQGQSLLGMENPQEIIEIKNFPEIKLVFDTNPSPVMSEKNVKKAVMVFEQAVGWLGEDVFLNDSSFSFEKEKKPYLFDLNKDVRQDYYSLLQEKSFFTFSVFNDRLNQRRRPLCDFLLSLKKLIPFYEIINWQITEEQADLLTYGANPHWHNTPVRQPVNKFECSLNIMIPKKICPLALIPKQIPVSNFSFSHDESPEISRELLEFGNEHFSNSPHFFGPLYHAKALQFLHSLEKEILRKMNFSQMQEFYEWIKSLKDYLQGDHVYETAMYPVYNDKILRYKKAYEYVRRKFEQKEDIKEGETKEEKTKTHLDGMLRKSLKKFGLKFVDFMEYQHEENKRTLFLLALETNFQNEIKPLLQKQEQLHNLLGAIEIARFLMNNFYEILGNNTYSKKKLILKQGLMPVLNQYIAFESIY